MIKRRSSLNTFSALSIGLSAACFALACGSNESTPSDQSGEEVPPDEPNEPNLPDPPEEKPQGPDPNNNCEDNEFLEDCGPDGKGGTGNTPAPPTGSARDLAEEAAQNLLKAKCGACHGTQLTEANSRGGMNYIDDMDQLVANQQVVPRNSEASEIIRRMRDGSMPLGGPEVADADIAIVAAFIDNPAFWPDAPDQVCDENDPLSFDDLYQDVAQDLARQEDDDQPFMRYVSLGNLAGAGKCTNTAMDLDRQGLIKMINSLSIETSVFVPEALDNAQTLYRIDLRELQWNREITVNGEVFADVWEAIIDANQYAVPFIGDEADDARADSGTDVPVMFLDSMLNAATIGNLYYAIVDIDVAQTLDDFVLNDLGIDVQENLDQEELIRAGTTDTDVSRQDRLVEGHDIGVRQGRYYQSFDFNDDQNESIFQNPFGFNEGGREAIFTLPNGLLAYAIADENGNFVEDSDILLDTNQGNFRAVTMVSCANCHVGGFIPLVDEVRDVVRRNALNLIQDGTLNQEQLEQLEEVYLDPAEFRRVIESDSNRFYLTALRDAELPVNGAEPISTVFFQFDQDMELSDAAGDLGVTAEELDDFLNELPGELGVLDGGTLDRDDFTAQYLESLCILQQVSNNRPDDALCAEFIGN